MSRSPAADDYDAIVDLVPCDRTQWPGYAYALVKRVLRLTEGGCEPAPAEPLLHDIRDPGLEPRLPVGSDFWTQKRATDVVVLGHAFARPGAPVVRSTVRCTVGERTKRITVWGRRFIEWSRSGRPRIGQPAAFESVAVSRDNAYGGVDTRVPLPPIRDGQQALAVLTDHPGIYPRNPFGKGYFVLPERFDGIELPALEDPDDPLSDERLVVGAPERWPRQPLPWALDWLHPLMFPRYLYLGVDAPLPAVDAELSEVARGYLPAGLRERLARGEASEPCWWRYYQEASLGMVFEPLAPGCPIEVAGMTPEGARVGLRLPEPPSIEIETDGARERVAPRLTSVVVRPAERLVALVYFARTASLPRVFLPGVHPHIPLAVRVGGGPPIPYPPPPVRRPAAGAPAPAAEKG